MSGRQPATCKPPLPTDLRVNCPYCGAPGATAPSYAAAAFYECQRGGLLVLRRDGRLRTLSEHLSIWTLSVDENEGDND